MGGLNPRPAALCGASSLLGSVACMPQDVTVSLSPLSSGPGSPFQMPLTSAAFLSLPSLWSSPPRLRSFSFFCSTGIFLLFLHKHPSLEASVALSGPGTSPGATEASVSLEGGLRPHPEG